MIQLIVLFLTIAEVVTVVACVKLLGFLPTLGLTLLSVFLGTILIRWQGLITAEKFANRLEQAEPPMGEAWDGFCILLAAALLIIPGLLTDFLALFLLLPFVRTALRHLLLRTSLGRGHYWFDAAALSSSRRRLIDVTCEDVTFTPPPGN